RERGKQPNRRDRNPGLRPGRLAGCEDLHGDRRPIGGSQERRRDGGQDGPREIGGRLLREDGELEARKEDEDARRVQEVPHQSGQRANACSWLGTPHAGKSRSRETTGAIRRMSDVPSSASTPSSFPITGDRAWVATATVRRLIGFPAHDVSPR